jgi:hypothetical protein
VSASNYFSRITGKIRLENGRYRKVYGKPKTPYRRRFKPEDADDEVKAELKRRALLYNPVSLKTATDKARNRLLRITREKANVLNASCQEVSAGLLVSPPFSAGKIIRQCALLT